MNPLPTLPSVQEPHAPPQGCGLRQSSGAFDGGVTIPKAPSCLAEPRWDSRILFFVLAALVLVAPCLAEEFYAADEDSLVQAIADAAAIGGAENFINFDRASINLIDAVVINGGFGPGHSLTIRPRPGLSSRPRTQLRSANGAEAILELHHVGNVTLQDVDLLRTTYNRSNLLLIESSTNVVVERCRVGSISSLGGQPGWANIYIQHPVHVIVRNTICFAYQPGTFDSGIVLHQETAMNAGLWLYNNLVADHRRFGINLTATGDSLLLLRNNVVANHPAAITPEPAAYRSNVDPFVTVISSHNAAFASPVMTKIEQQDSDQDIANADQPDFFQRDRPVAALAFYQTRWNTLVAANPNWNLFRLRDGGPLHEGGSVRGVTVQDGDPTPLLDVAVADDIEKDARPSNHGGVSHTDRGPDQFRLLTAGDITVDLRPRLPGLEPIRMTAGGFEVVAVGPQSDFPVVETVMRSGNYTAGGRLSGIPGTALALSRPVALAIRLDAGNTDLKFSWPVWAETYLLEEAAAVVGGSPDPSNNWKPVTQAPMVEQENFILRIAPMGTGNRFYRLRKSD